MHENALMRISRKTQDHNSNSNSTSNNSVCKIETSTWFWVLFLAIAVCCLWFAGWFPQWQLFFNSISLRLFHMRFAFVLISFAAFFYVFLLNIAVMCCWCGCSFTIDTKWWCILLRLIRKSQQHEKIAFFASIFRVDPNRLAMTCVHTKTRSSRKDPFTRTQKKMSGQTDIIYHYHANMSNR